MANVIKITDGTTDIDLYYDTDGFEMLAQGNEFGISKHRNLYHGSDYGDGAMLVRHNKENKEWSFRLAARGTTNDGTTAILAGLNRLVAQARNYQINGTGRKVYLYIKLDGATYATYYDVIDIEYDKAAFLDFYNIRQKELVFGDGLNIGIITKPTGYGAEQTLENFILNPHFAEDTDRDRLADCWNESGSPTTLMDGYRYLVRPYSQYVQTDNSGTDGIYSDAIPCSAYQGKSFVGYVWIYRSSGINDITLDVVGDDSGSLDTAKYNSATATATDSLGGTWRRLDVSGTVGENDTTLTIRIERLTGDASSATTYYVDKCYLQLGASSTPIGWSSSRKVNNYYDEDAVPYIDVIDISGDVESPLQLDIYPSTTDKISFIHIGRKSALPIHKWWGEGDGDADVGRTKDASDSITANTSWANVISGWATPSEQFGAYGKFVLVCALKSSSEHSGKIRGQLYNILGGVYTEETTVSLTTNWEIFITQPMEWPRTEETYTEHNNVVYVPSFQVKLDSGSATVYADFLYLIPCDEVYTITKGALSVENEYMRIRYNGNADLIYPYASLSMQRKSTEHLGGMVTAIPSAYQKFFFMFYGTSTSNKIHSLDYASVRIKYKPQTEFLL